DQPVRALGTERRPGRIRHAVEVALHRIDAGTVEIALLLEGRPGPGGMVAHAEGRGAVAVDPDAGRVLEDPPGAADVLPEGLRRLTVHPLVAIAVAGEFVSRVGDAAHEGRIALGHPAQGEEGGMHARLLEEFEQAFGVALDPALALAPGVAVIDG